MGRKYQIISGDGHLETPPDFVAFLPEKFKDRAPKLITLPDGGGDAWLMEGMPLTYASQNLRGRGKVKFAGQSYFKDDGSRTDGAGDGAQRLREQDEDGIDAELLFAPVFASRFLEKIPEHDVYLAMVRAYNDWLVDYCSIAPDRLFGNALMPISGIDDAVAELERAHELGFKSVQLLNSPNGGGGPKPEDDRFWEKALELDMPLSPHFSFAGVMNLGGPRHDTSQWPVEAGMTQHSQSPPAPTMAQLIVNGTFERFPELKFYFAEINAAIFPAALYYMDRDYLEYNSWFELELPKMPSQYMRDHALYGMVREPLAVKIGQELPHEMPLELFWWGSDFPHSVGTFPHSQKYIEETFADLSPELRHTLLVGNAAKHLHLDLDADITETPAA
ncbi:MAG TPA: amidohydrolase family protein [Acidimicrobiia bacterium]|nr:amidohydrolase family protein [Acidimicrobiia bacterium]